jgi:hypothetical protein
MRLKAKYRAHVTAILLSYILQEKTVLNKSCTFVKTLPLYIISGPYIKWRSHLRLFPNICTLTAHEQLSTYFRTTQASTVETADSRYFFRTEKDPGIL